MARTILLRYSRPDAYVTSLRGALIDDRHFDPGLLIGREDVDVIRPDGSPLVLFRKEVLTFGACERAYEPLLLAARPSLNRWDSAGGGYYPTKLDGTVSNTRQSDLVLSGTVGYFGCRQTTYTREQVDEWFRVLPFIRRVNDVFRVTYRERYEAQMAAVRETSPGLVIARGETAFTTVTVNRNFRTHVHQDTGDLKEGFGVMSVLDAGEYEGGYLVFPKWRVAVDMRLGDVLLADVHEYHGNTAIIGIEGRYERISTVFYYHTAMLRCGKASP